MKCRPLVGGFELYLTFSLGSWVWSATPLAFTSRSSQPAFLAAAVRSNSDCFGTLPPSGSTLVLAPELPPPASSTTATTTAATTRAPAVP